MPIANRYMIRYWASLITRKMYLKATIRYYFIILSVMMIKTQKKTRAGVDTEKKKHSAGGI